MWETLGDIWMQDIYKTVYLIFNLIFSLISDRRQMVILVIIVMTER